MKRFLLTLLVCFLLYGCSEQLPATTAPETTVQPVTTPDPGTYLPESSIEQKTDGAVRSYKVNSGSSNDVIPFGKDLLLFSYEENQVKLTRLTGENRSESHTAVLAGRLVTPQCTWTYGNEVAYYDSEDRCVVYLDGMLQEIERVELPEDAQAEPVLSEDLRIIYYCTQDQIRALDTETGISRLLRRQQCQWHSPKQLLFGDSILQCYVIDAQQNVFYDFISTETGQCIFTATNLGKLSAWQERYFASYQESACAELIFGTRGQTQHTLTPKEPWDTVYPLLNQNCVLTASNMENGDLVLQLYDLESGLCKASLTLEGVQYGYSYVSDGTYIWFFVCDLEQRRDVLCRWQPELSPVNDTTVYAERRFTRDDPDVAGLKACEDRAKRLSETYGVQLAVYEAPRQPEEYVFTYEHHVPSIELALDSIETALAKFPEGFFASLENGNLQIGFVRAIKGLSEDAVSDVSGLQYWINGEGYIALVIGDNMESTFYHELCHVLDSYIYANSVVLDDWNTLNPNDFAYDGTYSLYADRADGVYLEGETRAFVDEYSKTFAKEDRARILECAMTEGNAEIFASETMQSKLHMLCRGIRDAYGWTEDVRTFLWEQYLQESLAYQGKK